MEKQRERERERVEEAVRICAGLDWAGEGDDAEWSARFKALSGQRSDWEPLFLFWRHLILSVSRHLRISTLSASRVENVWFCRRGLTPLCIPRVLQEMHCRGDLLLQSELIDPSSGHFYQIFRKVGRLIGAAFQSSTPQDAGPAQDLLIIKPLLEEKLSDVIKILNEGHWTSSCVITMNKFRDLFNGIDEANAALSLLHQTGKARYFSVRGNHFLEGVKISLVAGPVEGVTRLDYDLLNLIWTEEKLQEQIDALDRRWNSSRKMALGYYKAGNKAVAMRHIRQSKLLTESRLKSTSLLERVEQVLRLISDAQSAHKVNEAIKIGSRAINEQRMSVEEVQSHMEELDELVFAQKQVDAALEQAPMMQTVDIEDGEIEEELRNLEAELLKDELPAIGKREQSISASAPLIMAGEEKKKGEDDMLFIDSLNCNMSSLKLEEAA